MAEDETAYVKVVSEYLSQAPSVPKAIDCLFATKPVWRALKDPCIRMSPLWQEFGHVLFMTGPMTDKEAPKKIKLMMDFSEYLQSNHDLCWHFYSGDLGKA